MNVAYLAVYPGGYGKLGFVQNFQAEMYLFTRKMRVTR